MAGNIYRAMKRNPDFIGNLADMAGSYAQNEEQKNQYQQFNDILNPETTNVKMSAPGQTTGENPTATIPLKGGGTAVMPRFQGVETKRTPRSILDLSPQETLRIGSILKLPAVNTFNMLASQAAEQRKLRMPQKDNLAPGTVPGSYDLVTGKWTQTGPQAAMHPQSITQAYLAMLAGGGDPQALKAIELLKKSQSPGAPLWSQAHDDSGKPKTEKGEGGKSFYVEETTDRVGKKVERLGKPATETPKEPKAGTSPKDKAVKEIQDLTKKNEALGQKIRDYYGSNLSAKPEQKEWLDRTAQEMKDAIAGNEQRIEELNIQIGGSWRRDKSKSEQPASKEGSKGEGF
jgi:hypothetical protein